MTTQKHPVMFMLIFTAAILFVFLLLQPFQVFHFREYIAILFPKGAIALEQLNLLLVIQLIMLLVVLPVYVFTFIFSWKFRFNNPKGKYDPDLVDNVIAEFFWWGIPIVLTGIIAVLTWQKTQELDPYKPIASPNKPITIQVVALQWRWLFIYPEEKIATINFIQIPENTPIHFEITADAPMNSFWIPQLGGQIYAMPKMKTELNLIADQRGDFRGSSANLSGAGFAGMTFIARASTKEDYDAWVKTAKNTTATLDASGYETLAKPSEDAAVVLFKLSDDSLFHHVIMKYMHPKEKL